MTDSRPATASSVTRGYFARARDLWSLVRFADHSAQKAFSQAVAINTLAASVEIGSLLLVQQAASALVSAPQRGTVPIVPLVLIGTMLLSALLRLVGQRAIIRTQFAVATSLTTRAFSTLQHQDYSAYLEHGASRAFAVFEELQVVGYNAVMPFISGIISLATAILILGVISMLYPAIGVIIATLSAVALMIGVQMKSRPAGDDPVPELGRRRARLIVESRTAFRDICLTNGQTRMCADFEEIEREFRARLADTIIGSQTARSEIEIAGLSMFLIATLLWPLLDADAGELVPALGVLALGGLRLLPHLAIIRSAAHQISAHGQVTSGIRQLLDHTLASSRVAQGAVHFRESVTLSAISVARSDRDDTLKGLNLVIPFGSRVGIVGASGSGKSTLLDVLSGLITPSSGEVRVDEQAITPSNATAWRDRIGVVSQSSLLVGETLVEAICYPTLPEDADADRLAACVAQTGLAELAIGLAQGLETPLGEALTRLSGGQRQRLALAHALYRAHDLLVLDEATSNLDMESELVIRSCLDRLPRDITVVLVTHRPALLDCCDTVYRLENGVLSPSPSDPAP